ncbi:alpha/beta fold hydrolase [Gordonia polyisoprenivorans]|uniref:alpha/beta fold hydrolase n=2 Tax=Gordonia TaxID=2053 RepID=UPI001AD6C567|nr:alpha/beta hydrolase [Gordonia polyisoprenivorans]QTI70859.1 alpha/beta hydrolase [Gordonia polyisoprenivorans]
MGQTRPTTMLSRRRTAVRERRLVVGSHRTRVLESDGDGPLLLLLHGFADSADTWRDLLEVLGSRGIRAAAVDLPGFGRASGISRDGRLLEIYDDFVAAVLAALRGPDDPPAIVVGNSMGATVAVRAATARDDVAAAVALAPAGLGFRPALHHASDAIDHLLPMLRVAYRVPYPAVAVQGAIAVYYRVRLAHGARNAWRFGSHFRGMGEFRRVGVLGRRLMAEIQQGVWSVDDFRRPITLVWGSADPVCDVRGADAFIEAVPGTRLVMIPGAGHLPQIDAPERVADILAEVAAASDLAAPGSQPMDRKGNRR